MSLLKPMEKELARALAVLSLVFFSLLAGSPAISSTSIVLRQAGIVATVVTDVCGHDQQGVACHAPNACCRPDEGIPPRPISSDRAFVSVVRIAFGDTGTAASRTAGHVGFRSRAPPEA